MHTAPQPIPPPEMIEHLSVLGVLLASILAGGWVYRTLVRHATVDRRRQALLAWCKAHRARLTDPAGVDPPAALRTLHVELMRPLEWVAGVDFDLLRLQTLDTDGRANVWHVAIRAVPGDWGTAALRPGNAATSLIDLLKLPDSIVSRQSIRFEVRGHDILAARRLVDGPARTLLPGDIGLVRTGPWLVLDFTARPFDPIDLSRILRLLNQLATVV